MMICGWDGYYIFFLFVYIWECIYEKDDEKTRERG